MATAPVQTSTPNGRAERPRPTLLKGDDAVPRGLAVASAVTLRLMIVVGGLVLVALGAARLMLVVLPMIIAALLTTPLTPAERRQASAVLSP
jgi:hypothetical protein